VARGDAVGPRAPRNVRRHYARLPVGGKLIRRSLESTLLSVAKLKRPISEWKSARSWRTASNSDPFRLGPVTRMAAFGHGIEVFDQTELGMVLHPQFES
jgi:hypothetical protein